jgi:hypothetical protein
MSSPHPSSYYNPAQICSNSESKIFKHFITVAIQATTEHAVNGQNEYNTAGGKRKEETGMIARFRGIEPSGLNTELVWELNTAWELNTELNTEPTNTNIEPRLRASTNNTS